MTSSASDSDAVARLETLIRDDWFDAYMRRYHPGEQGVYVPGAIDPHVAQGFLRGLDAGLFPVEDGEVEWPGPTPEGWPKASTPNVYWEGRKDQLPRPISAGREALVTVAAVSDLHLDYGWPLDRIRIESPAKEGAGRYALDFLVLGPHDEAILAGEAKRSGRDLDRVLEEIQACAAMGRHSIDDCHPSKPDRLGSHRKFGGLMAFQPPCFWAVAEGYRRAFLVTYPGEGLTLHEVDDLPTAHGS
jgi:hypothetical protein